jgi:2-polyprenyl-3-methyl-5-hydroxy-6-metoxy-1,4-benzoquinol methylase
LRHTSYGQASGLSPIDHLGVFLSSRRLRRSIRDVAGLRVADFGCGYRASIAMQLLDRAAEIVLVDIAIDPDVAAAPKVRAIEGVLPGALEELPTASLDVILCTSVLEHLDHPKETLAQIRRVLSPGGLAAIIVPTWFGKRFLEFSAFRLGWSPREEMDDHKAYYDPRELWMLLVQAGFRPHEIVCRRHKFGMNTFALCRLDEGDRQPPRRTSRWRRDAEATGS